MGKKAKEHRRKVDARNARIKQQKSGMQKAFDMLLKQELEKLKNDQVKVEAGGQAMNFDLVEEKVVDHAFKFTPNEEESAKINKEFDEVTETEG
jgi:hypothetical protein